METVGQANGRSLNVPVVRELLVRFLQDETRTAGFSRGIVGLSGGIDSAVVAYLAAEALGPSNVRAVLMPYRTSSPSSLDDASLIVRELGIPSETVDITPVVESLVAGFTDNVRRGNIMARARMIVLYDVSAREKALVFGTSNKTELMLGYGTLYGDLACALNPLGDLYKTQVRELAAALGVPQRVMEKKPSADLWEGQTDEGDFGFTYDEVDGLLSLLVDERRTSPEVIAAGYAPALIERVQEMIRLSQFKRRPPVIAKVSTRTVNIDFRYPRDWGT